MFQILPPINRFNWCGPLRIWPPKIREFFTSQNRKSCWKLKVSKDKTQQKSGSFLLWETKKSYWKLKVSCSFNLQPIGSIIIRKCWHRYNGSLKYWLLLSKIKKSLELLRLGFKNQEPSVQKAVYGWFVYSILKQKCSR